MFVQVENISTEPVVSSQTHKITLPFWELGITVTELPFAVAVTKYSRLKMVKCCHGFCKPQYGGLRR